jgi:hypothetical protein
LRDIAAAFVISQQAAARCLRRQLSALYNNYNTQKEKDRGKSRAATPKI